MTPEGATAWLVAMPLRSPFLTAESALHVRRLVILRLTEGTTIGWGEACPVPGYSRETVDQTWESLTGGGPLTAHARVAVEAAAADLAARRAGEPLWRFQGGIRSSITAGAVVSLDTPERALTEAERYVAAGYRHLKVKVAPGHDAARVEAVRSAFPDLSLGADGNGSYRPGADLRWADDLNLEYFEQPYPGMAEHAVLRSTLRTPVCLDESVAGPDSAGEALVTAPMLALKPSRLGWEATRRIHAVAASVAGARLRTGGMLESGVGRAHALAAASLRGFTVPGDLGASDRYFERDVVQPAWVLSDGAIELPERPGIGVTVDEDLLDALAEPGRCRVPVHRPVSGMQ